MKSLVDFVRYERAKPLGFDDLRPMVMRKGLRYMEYATVAKGAHSLKSLLPKTVSGVLILFTDKAKRNGKIGHFCLLFKHPRSGVHFFDPLGVGLLTVDRLTGNTDVLLRVLKAHHVQQNSTRFQKLQHDTQSCGRHCVTRYNLADFTPDEYRNALRIRSLSYDDVVTLLTLNRDLSSWSRLLPRRTQYGHS